MTDAPSPTDRHRSRELPPHSAALLRDMAASLAAPNPWAGDQATGGAAEGGAADLLTALVQRRGLEAAVWVTQDQGGWKTRLSSDRQAGASIGGTPLDLPLELVAAAVDEGVPRASARWVAVPHQLSPERTASLAAVSPVSCLLLRLRQAEDAAAAADALCQLAAALLVQADLETQSRDRIDQLTRVSRAAAAWQQAQWQESGDEDALLRRIADTATDLLGCQRASIFLWDKRRGTLVGRPALGIDDSPLVIPDDAGIVGEVLASGEPQIWNGGRDDESRINRQVDRSLDFETRSLVAVPLFGSRGETLGVFEAINHHQNRFDRRHVLVLSDLATHAAVAIESARAQRSLADSRERLVRDAARSSPLVGEHREIAAVRQTATKVAGTDLSVLILGSNGTGKEIVARHIHYQSERRHGPFVAVNCAALVESLLESELFGHEKGAFTDAAATRAGKFELASGGTLFLDEVGDLSPGGQAKLLRVLEQREVVRVGGSVPLGVDVRVIAATNQPLDRLIEQKRFREDLFFRLNVVSVKLPDLADRGRDVLLLAEHFLEHFSHQVGRKVPRLSESAQTALLSHRWPGNVRELRNTIERVSYLTSGEVIQATDLELRPGGPLTGNPSVEGVSSSPASLAGSLAESTRRFQIQHIRQAIDDCDGNMTEAAHRLDLHRSNLYRKMKQLGMGGSGSE